MNITWCQNGQAYATRSVRPIQQQCFWCVEEMEAVFWTLWLASGLSSKDAGIQATTQLHVVGPDTLEKFTTLSHGKRMVTIKKWQKFWRSLKRVVFHGETPRGKDMSSTPTTNTTVIRLTNMSQTSRPKPRHVNLRILSTA